MIKYKNIMLGLKDQMPLIRFIKNLWKGHLIGLFHKRSHYRDNGNAKVTYNTKDTAKKFTEKLSIKHGVHFSNYKCLYCDGYHLGKNRENKK